MGQPNWRQITPQSKGDYLTVPEEPGQAWTVALEYVTTGQLLKIVVEHGSQWEPFGMPACGPDGDAAFAKPAGVPVAKAARGALIGKIGGSTADQEGDDSMVLFTVGRVCVLAVPEKKSGALFLGVNDAPMAARQLQKQLRVQVFAAF